MYDHLVGPLWFSLKRIKRITLDASGANNIFAVPEISVYPMNKIHVLFSVFSQNEQSDHLSSDAITINAMVRTVAAAACSCVTVVSPEGSDVC